MKMSWYSLGCCLLFLCSHVVAQCIVNNTHTVTDFDIYKGKWHEIYYMAKSYYGPNDMWTDVTNVYTVQANGSVHADFVWRYPVTGKCSYMPAALEPTNQAGKYGLVYLEWGSTYDYWVLTTDYTSYAVVYGCREQNSRGECNGNDKINVWVWSRDKRLTPTETETIRMTLSSAVCVALDDLTKPANNLSCETVPSLVPETCGASAPSLPAFLHVTMSLLLYMHTCW